MRIAVLTSLFPSSSFPFEGIFAERRWRGMRDRGHEVSVTHPLPRTPWPLARGRWAGIHAVPAREERDGIPVEHPRYLHVPRVPLRNARVFARAGLQSVLRRGRPDVVVCDYAWPSSAAAPALADAGIPCVVSGRGSDVLEVAGEAGLAEPLARFLCTAGHWCAVSEHLLARMDELGGGTGTLVPNGVDLDLFHPGNRVLARRDLGLREDAPLVLVVGHLIPRKDPLLALAAFAALSVPDARLVFVGEGALAEDVREEARRSGLDERVTLVGAAPPERLSSWYRAADCLLLTSLREGRPNVVIEALACGTPAVAVDAGGTSELLVDLPELVVGGESRRDPVRIAAHLAAALESPPSEERLTNAVRALSWDRSLDALDVCLETAVGVRAG